ncbi:PPE family protein, SVP subgroup [Mycobacterium sp. HUMS_1102779]|uniref:PPE family protein, SVP subgroup n=1 Tax=Mycobacterium sp. HUMS_1102779 TaxID=3383487 RepID=UPI003899F07A
MGNPFVQVAKSLGAVGGPATTAAGGPAKATTGLGGLLGGAAAPVTARLGEAVPVGRLSVPPLWSDAAPAPRPAAEPLAVSNIGEAPDPGTGHLFGGVPLSAPGAGPHYGFRPVVMARPPFAG